LNYTVIHSDQYWRHNQAWSINSTSSGIRTDIMNCLIDQLVAMVSRHNKVFLFRFDLRLRTETPNNKIMSDFNRRLFRRIKRHYATNEVGFAWVREKEKAKSQHYHCALMLDGNKIQLPQRVQSWITEIWTSLDGYRPHWSAYHNIRRNDSETVQKAMYHISYLAKPRGKGYGALHTKDYNSSRLKPTSCQTI
jgi:hypothetical protein